MLHVAKREGKPLGTMVVDSFGYAEFSGPNVGRATYVPGLSRGRGVFTSKIGNHLFLVCRDTACCLSLRRLTSRIWKLD